MFHMNTSIITVYFSKTYVNLKCKAPFLEIFDKFCDFGRNSDNNNNTLYQLNNKYASVELLQILKNLYKKIEVDPHSTPLLNF